jgi:hemolysin activation/secretion protein
MNSFWHYLFQKTLITFPMVLLLGNNLPVEAQALPPDASPRPDIPPFTPIEPTQPETPQLKPLPPVEDLLEQPPATPPEQQPGDLLGTIEVKRFQIEGSTVFDEEELQELIKQYTNRPITFADLLQVETILTRFYNNQGYINSGAVVPQQNIKDGVIKVQIIEGRLEDILVQVNGRLSEEYVRSRIARGGKTPLNINKLQESLQLLQLDPLIENLTAELSVGAKRDRWNLEVEVNQAPAFKPELFVNNSRTPSVGSFQRGIALNHNNFAGEGDRASFIYKNTDGSDDYEFGYTVPVNSLNGTVGFRYRFVESEIVEPPFDELDIDSETDQYQLTFRQPILVTADSESTQELAVGVELSRQANKTTLLNQPFPLSVGANDEGETTVSAVRFFQDWTQRTRREVLAARSQFSVGLDLFDSTTSENAPDSKFFAWRGQAQWLRQLDAESNINLLLRSDIQLSTSELVPLEQFSLGGAESVRGYRQDALLGDNGIFASAEVRVPVFRWNNNTSSVAVIHFLDFGTTWNKSDDDNQQDEDTLFALGLGLQLSLSDRLNARLDWGIPLVEVEDQDRTLQEDGIYFSLEYLPF